jgi:DNA polymerase-4
MPSVTAGRLCPNGIFVRPHMDHYREESRHIMQIIAQLGAVIEPMSIDEAYLDMSALSQAESADASLLKAVPLARHLKQRILSERKLTATIGIASNKLLAKIASDHKKPDGLTVISEQEKVSFLRPLPVRVIYGVGKVTEQTLGQAGIVTAGDLQDYAGHLRALVGSFGPRLKQFAFGEDDRPLEIGDEIKSISNEETFLKDTEDRKVLRTCLKEQAADIATRLKHRRLGAHTVQVKVRYSDFITLTRQFSVEEPITEAVDIYRLGCFLLGRDKLVSHPLRLLGPPLPPPPNKDSSSDCNRSICSLITAALRSCSADNSCMLLIIAFSHRVLNQRRHPIVIRQKGVFQGKPRHPNLLDTQHWIQPA